MSGDGEDGLLVGSGSFRVDRAHALRKLQLYQLPADVGGWLLWSRCAAACGATQADVRVAVKDFTMRFSGRPFSRAELEDPFAPLFGARRPGRERGFQLALGLLQALSSGAREAVVTSGTGPERVALTARSLSDLAVAPAPDGGTQTVLRVRWSAASQARERFLNVAYVTFRTVPLLYPERLRLTGNIRGPGPGEAPDGRRFAAGAAQGLLSPPAFHTPPDSHLSLFKLGVFVCEHRELFPWVKVAGWLNDDKLSLTASQTGVAADGRFKALMRLAAREAEAMLLEAAREHPALMAEARAAAAEDRRAGAVWDQRMKWGPQAGADAAAVPWWRGLLDPGAGRTEARRRRVLLAAERTLWLRDASARLGAPGRTPPEALRGAVAAALAAAQGPV